MRKYGDSMFYDGEVKGSLNTVKDFIEGHEEFYLFGADTEGRSFYFYLKDKGKKILAFIDNNPLKIGTALFDLPILNIKALKDKKAKIIITSIHSDEISKQLNDLGLKPFVDYISSDNYYWLNLPQFFDSLGTGFSDFFCENKPHYEKVLKLLDDDSAEFYKRVINYRLTVFMPEVRGKKNLPQPLDYFRKKNQEKNILRKNLELNLKDFLVNSIVEYPYDFRKYNISKDINTIIDAGGYVGNSAVVMNYLYPDANIYMFEPDKSILTEIEENISTIKKIKHIRKGIWKKNGKLNFNISEIRETSSIGIGKAIIDTVSIDDFIKTENLKGIDFIKLDIEGAELEALEGAKESIIKFRPIVAISIYHKPKHLYELPLWVVGNLKDYTIKIDHPSGQFVWGTLCYAIPNECFNDLNSILSNH
jgi:FkbM family methyltransferase